MRPSAVQTRVGRQVQIILDLAAWGVGLLLIDLVRFDSAIPRSGYRGLLRMIVLAAALQVLIGLALSLYRRRYRYGSFEEVAGLAATVTLVTPVLVAVDVEVASRWVPLSVAVAGGIPALVIMASTRYTWRYLLQRRRRPQAEDVARVLVFGAGQAGQQVVDALLHDRESRFLPVALLDDDSLKRNLRVRGVRVAGGRAQMRAAKRRFDADTLLIAVPSADAALVRVLSELAEEAALDVKILPPVRDLIDGRVGLADIRDVQMADLLGRRQVDTDLNAIAHYLTGKRVLVTGAGGSIGSELCRQIQTYGPAELIMLDRDESLLHAVQLSMFGRALLDDDATVLADIRDSEHVLQVFRSRRPHVVFHAAALKHMPMLQRYPGEAVKTNVWGTLAVLEAAMAVGVERFVNISTDKAANPANVLGYSKRLAERLTARAATAASGTYLSVRFGNVLGSRGSVLTAFAAQIAAGGPITVTDPDVTRFFMTVEEAVQLVIQAGAIGRDGEVLVLDMGEPVRIADVAHRLAAEASRPVQVVFTGLRPGEKLHEDLIGTGEEDVRPIHPMISHVAVPPLDVDDVRTLRAWDAPIDLIDRLAVLCLPEASSPAAQRGIGA